MYCYLVILYLLTSPPRNGVFNLMISLLPPRMLNLAKFAGFSGDRELGLGLIEEASQLGGMRSSLASLMLLGYHAYLGK